MKKEKALATYETRYKHKLNMLESGTAILKWIGIILLGGLVMRMFRLELVSYIVWGLAGAIFLLLIILLVIEAHQDDGVPPQESEERSYILGFRRIL